MELARHLVKTGYYIALGLRDEAKSWLKEYETNSSRRAMVTEADLKVEAMMRERIQSVFPTDTILGEENAEACVSLGGPVWALDPIDGTSNYSRRLDPWAVSAAVLVDGIPEVAAVAVGGDIWETHSGLPGVLKNSKPITPHTELHSFKDAFLSCECLEWFDDGHKIMREMWNKGGTWRGISSGIAQCMYVIDGRLDGFFHPGLALWDHASTALLVEKSGKCISRWDGTPQFPHIWKRVLANRIPYLAEQKDQYQFDLVAASPALHEELVTLLRPYACRREQ